MLDHQYIGVSTSLGLTIRTWTSSTGEPSGSQASTWKTTSRIRSNSYIRSTGVPSGCSTRAACSGSHVVGECPMVPMFHSTPPANHALRSARFAGWKTGFRYSSSRPVGLCDQRPQPAAEVEQEGGPQDVVLQHGDPVLGRRAGRGRSRPGARYGSTERTRP